MTDVDHCGAYFADRIVYTQKVLAFFDQYLRKSYLQLVEPLGAVDTTQAQEQQDLRKQVKGNVETT